VRPFVRWVALIAVATWWLSAAQEDHASAASCWARTPLPGVQGLIKGSDAAPGGVVWAVGHTPIHLDPVHPLALRWSAGVWHTTPTPPVRFGELSDVAVVEPNAVWAVGTVSDHPLVLRWNGRGWRRIWVPTPGTRASLMAIDVMPGGGLLVAGRWSSKDASGPLILRRTASGWRVSLRRVGLFEAALRDIVSVPGATWAVGEYGRPLKPLVLRFTPGRGWRRVAVRAPFASQLLDAVAAAGPDDALAVGWRQAGDEQRAWMIRWNGDRWAVVPRDRAPGLGRSGWLEAVTMRPSGEAWAVGARARLPGQDYTDMPPMLVLHRNGGRWIREMLPDASRGILFSVVADPTPWTLGAWDVYEDGGGRPLAYRC